MQKIAVIQISEAGTIIAAQLTVEMKATIIQRKDVGKEWKKYDAFVFIGAMGICVRTIAPYIEDKHADPAVICIDSLGQNVISVLSGHIGGANELTRDIAALIGAREVITTQSDNAGLWALDTFEQRFDWPVASDIQTSWRPPNLSMSPSSTTSARPTLGNMNFSSSCHPLTAAHRKVCSNCTSCRWWER